MSKVVIFGNSGSGKSTLAKELALKNHLAHLDLDTVAWKPITPPERLSILESRKSINDFLLTKVHCNSSHNIHKDQYKNEKN